MQEKGDISLRLDYCTWILVIFFVCCLTSRLSRRTNNLDRNDLADCITFRLRYHWIKLACHSCLLSIFKTWSNVLAQNSRYVLRKNIFFQTLERPKCLISSNKIIIHIVILQQNFEDVLLKWEIYLKTSHLFLKHFL